MFKATTENAIKHFTKGIDQLNLVATQRTDEAVRKTDKSARLQDEATDALADADRAKRISMRLTELLE